MKDITTLIFVGGIIGILALCFGATNGVGAPNPAVDAAVQQYWSNSPIGIMVIVGIVFFVIYAFADAKEDDEDERGGRKR